MGFLSRILIGAVFGALSATACGGAREQARSPARLWEGVRVSRSYFDQALSTEAVMTDRDGKRVRLSRRSRAVWSERAPPGPAPQPGYLADFRDRLGCVAFSEDDSVRLCVWVSPDVSTVQLKKSKIQVEGLAPRLTQALGCRVTSRQLKYAGSFQEAGGRLRVALKAVPECRPKGVRVDLIFHPDFS
jgi:hypothetical protein